MATSAPARAISSAMPLPMPRELPVMRGVLPSSLPTLSLLACAVLLQIVLHLLRRLLHIFGLLLHLLGELVELRLQGLEARGHPAGAHRSHEHEEQQNR